MQAYILAFAVILMLSLIAEETDHRIVTEKSPPKTPTEEYP